MSWHCSALSTTLGENAVNPCWERSTSIFSGSLLFCFSSSISTSELTLSWGFGRCNPGFFHPFSPSSLSSPLPPFCLWDDPPGELNTSLPPLPLPELLLLLFPRPLLVPPPATAESCGSSLLGEVRVLLTLPCDEVFLVFLMSGLMSLCKASCFLCLVAFSLLLVFFLLQSSGGQFGCVKQVILLLPLLDAVLLLAQNEKKGIKSNQFS